MTWEYLHLISHSFPIVLYATGAVAGAAGWAAGREELERWALVAFVVGGAFAIPAYVTGLAAADVEEARTFVSAGAVQTHRTAATWAAVLLLLTGILAAFALWEREDRRLRRFVLLVGIVAAVVTAWAAHLGSRIQHFPIPASGGAAAAEISPSLVEGPGRKPPAHAVAPESRRTAASPDADRRTVDRRSSNAGASSQPEVGAVMPSNTPLFLSVALGLLLVVVPAGPAAGQAETRTDLAERARQLTREALLVDGHNDLPWRLREWYDSDLRSIDLTRRVPDERLHTDIPRLREGGVDAQFWAAYVPVDELGPQSTVYVLEQIDLIKRFTARYPDAFEMAYTAEDVRRIKREGRIASLIGIEGGHAMSNSLPVLRELYEAGARYMTLTHSAALAWADAAGVPPVHGGLTDFGREVVREMNRLGMLVDLSHVTAEVMRDAIRASRAPVIFSHSSARAVADHPRNVPDDVLRMVRENGGVVMVNFFSGFVVPESAENIREYFSARAELRERYRDDEQFQEEWQRWQAEHPIVPGDVSVLADHVDHIVRVAGADHVGLGSDYDGVSVLPRGMEDVTGFPLLVEELLRRGWSEEDVRKLLGENLLRVMGRTEEVAADLRRREHPSPRRLPFHALEPEQQTGS